MRPVIQLLSPLVVLAAAGCGAFAPNPNDTGAEVNLNWGFERPTTAPQFTAEELGAYVETWSNEFGVPLPHNIYARYLNLLDEGDVQCPGDGPDLFHLEGCTSESGWYYIGNVIVYQEDERDENGLGSLQTGFSLADVVIESPEGLQFSGGGALKMKATYNKKLDQFHSELVGSWSDQTGESTAWLGAGASFDYMLSLNGDHLASKGYVGIGSVALFFDHLIMNTPHCSLTPTNSTLWVRQEDGSWNSLAFADDCSGCATAVWNDEIELGETCVDLSNAAAALLTAIQEIP